jgi:phage/plasmid-associated DNA primase
MNTGGREAMLYDLLEKDISTIDLRTFPRTEALLDQIQHSMDPVRKFWFQKLQDGFFAETEAAGKWPEYILSQTLYQYYVNYAEDLGSRRKLPDFQFGKELRLLCPGIERKRMTTGNARPRIYVLPDLKTCRRDFEKLLNMDLPWDEDTDES